jgi:hypothetical protein
MMKNYFPKKLLKYEILPLVERSLDGMVFIGITSSIFDEVDGGISLNIKRRDVDESVVISFKQRCCG